MELLLTMNFKRHISFVLFIIIHIIVTVVVVVVATSLRILIVLICSFSILSLHHENNATLLHVISLLLFLL